MHGSDDWDDDEFKVYEPTHWWPTDLNEPAPAPSKNFHHWDRHWRFPAMELVIALVVAIGAIIILVVLCRCCCRKSSGRVLAPPPGPDAPAPYPQQQFVAAPTSYPATTVTLYPVAAAAPYPAPAPYPSGAHYPAQAPYPTGAPYPGASHPPYPAAGGAGPPYPTGAPYPNATPFAHAPTAPDANACPPSYDQVMQHTEKQPPYNPNVAR